VYIEDYIKDKILLLDGATGTMLQKTALAAGERPELLNLANPAAVSGVHRAYLRAGSKMILTNTFGANDRKLAGSGHSCEEVVAAAVRLAKEAAAEFGAYAALDIGPVGELLEPAGALAFDEAYELFRRQITAGAAAGADAIYIETMIDLLEARCAVLAAKENCGLPVFCTMSFEANMKTFLGAPVSAMALTLEGLGADYIGVNCSVGPKQALALVRELAAWTSLPMILKPNAGMPSISNGETVYDLTPDEFADFMAEALGLGVAFVGGCCGTTPEHIAKLAALVKGRKPAKRAEISVPAVCSALKTVPIDRVRVIGERINPAGKPRFQRALYDLINGDAGYIARQAVSQIESGADILDVNVGYPPVDEKQAMTAAVKCLHTAAAPLCLDSSDAAVLEAGLRVYGGKAIVNSVNGDPAVLAKILPIAKKYGAAVIGLTLDGRGVPRTAAERLEIARVIVAAADKYGIPKKDVFIDCLTLTAGAEQAIAHEALKAIRLVKRELGVKTVLGVSNVSFGLPAREVINQVFLAMALEAGLDLPIINPNIKSMVDTVCCYHQLTNIDAESAEYLKRFADAQSAPPPAQTGDIRDCIEKGLKADVPPLIAELLKTRRPLDIVNGLLIPALDSVGTKFESGEFFLPQLLKSAEAARAAFDMLKEAMPPEARENGEKIVLATVEGDVHDIGKNIVKTVLENYGYAVIDLGRDVPPEAILQAAREHGARLVGLSALMTTTAGNMGKTVAHIKSGGADISVMVGGAVITREFARSIGADFYGRDAVEAVSIAKKVFNMT